jgi:hypothetical protein
MRIRTSQPEGCFYQRSIRGQSPLTVRVSWGNERQRCSRFTVEGTAAYATQLKFSFAEKAPKIG